MRENRIMGEKNLFATKHHHGLSSGSYSEVWENPLVRVLWARSLSAWMMFYILWCIY